MQTSGLKILIIAILIVAIGILSIYSSTYQKEDKSVYKRQIFWALLGLACFLFFSNLNYRRIWDITYFIYAFAVFLLLLVFLLGVVRLGAQRWIKIIWLNFQPSELAKLIIVIFLSRYFSAKTIYDVSLASSRFGVFRSIILPFVFIAIPMVLIIEQPDLGSALMVFFIFIAMLYASGVKMRYLFMFLGLNLLSLPIAWNFLRDYQRDRIMVFINPNIDPLGAGYTVIQSKIAIGSGGFFGKGLFSGTQSQLHFLPESHTDFIFATFAEEWGLAGSLILLLLYYILIREGINIASRTQDYFGRLLAFGISLMLAMQIFINITMTLGLAPIVGLPLPLMSYGGSSMFVTFISLGILVNINKTRAVF
jgi:rod shape determining protein RodA